MGITAHFYKMGRAAADDRSRGKSYSNANAASPCAGSCIPEAKGPFKPETANLNAFLLDGRHPFSFSGKKMGVAFVQRLRRCFPRARRARPPFEGYKKGGISSSYPLLSS